MTFRKCIVCGCEKYCPLLKDYRYKVDGKFCCSWTCYRKKVKEKEEKSV